MQHCSSEGRAFFVIDSLSEGCLVWTRKALMRLGSTLAVTLKQPCPVGVALLQRKPGQAQAQLQIVLRLGASFAAKEWLSCVKRLPAAPGTTSVCDGQVLSSALLHLMQHMQKLPARPDCQNHVFILSSSFAACATSPKMQKMLQLASMQPSYSIHFLQLTGPEAELQATAAAAGAAGADPCQLQPAQPPAPDDSFHQMLRAMPNCTNMTHDAFVADCEAVTDLMCQAWLRELLTPAHGSSSNGSPPAAAPDILLHFGGQSLPCSVQQHILQLDPWLLPAHLCPCHHTPMQPSCNSSAAAAAHAAAAAAAAAASDSGSMSALLLLPEAAPWSCSITGQPVMAPLSCCPTDARILQLGRHTQLTMPPTAAAASAGPAASKLPGQAGSDISSKLRALQALPLAPGQPCEVTAQHKVPPSAVDSMCLYGMPLLLTPCASGGGVSSSTGAAAVMGADVGAALAGRDQDSMGQQEAGAVTASEAGMVMRALCQLLLEEQQVLLASSHHDLLRHIHLPLQQWYMLQPAADGSGLLLRWVASREQLLPPKRRDANALGSSKGGSAAAGPGAEGYEDEVVLLDAEQLESVKASLASLSGLGRRPGSVSSSAVSAKQHAPEAAATAGAEGQAAIVLGPEAAAGEAVSCEGEPGEVDMSLEQQQQQPLLLSCGLDDWVSSVLEASAATYTPAAAPPPAEARPPAGMGQGAQGLLAPPAAAAARAVPVHAVRQGAVLPPGQLQQVQGGWQQGNPGAGAGQVGQHTMQAAGGAAGQQGGYGPQHGAPLGHGGGSAMPPVATAHPRQHQQQQQQAHTDQGEQQQPGLLPPPQQQHPGVADGAAPAAGFAVGSGKAGARRGGGRGRRASNTAASTGKKLRLSKV